MRGFILKKSSFKDVILKDDQFKVGDRIINLAISSLCCKFNNKNKVRVFAVSLIENPWFDRFIMTTIIINSIGMAMFDYYTENKCSYLSNKAG